MKKIGTGVGTLVLVGMVLLLGGVILKFAGLNLLEPLFYVPASFFVVANTCFLLALIIDKFDKPE